MSSADHSYDDGDQDVIRKPYRRDPSPGRRFRRDVVIATATALFCVAFGLAFGLFSQGAMVVFFAPVAVLAGLCTWALPQARTAPTRTLEFLFFAFLIAFCIWPNYLAIAIGGLPWITLQRITVLPMTAAFLICLSVSKAFRSELRSDLKSLELVWILAICFGVIQIVSVAFTPSPGGAIDRIIGAQTTCTVMFFVACYVFSKPGRVELWMAIVWRASIVIGLIGIWEMVLAHVVWAGHIPSFLQIQDPNVVLILAGSYRRYVDIYRIESVFTNPIGLSEFISLFMPFLIHFAVSNYRPAVRVAAALTIPFLVFVSDQTHSRSGMMGIFLGVLFYSAYWGGRRWLRRRGDLIGPTVVLSYPALFVAALSATFLVGRLRAKIWGSGATAASTAGRMAQYKAGIPLILKHPWGYGFGHGAVVLGFRPAGIITIDSYWLEVALDLGLQGFFVFYGMIAFAIFSAGRYALLETGEDREQAFLGPLAVSLAVFFVVKGVYAQQDNHPLMFMMLGMVVALVHRYKATAPSAAARHVGTGVRTQAARLRASSPTESMNRQPRTL